MREERLEVSGPEGQQISLPLTFVHTLIVGSGADDESEDGADERFSRSRDDADTPAEERG